MTAPLTKAAPAGVVAPGVSTLRPGLVCWADPTPWAAVRPHANSPATVLAAIRRAERRLAAAGITITPLERQPGEVPS